jgi:HEAT repeat protein
MALQDLQRAIESEDPTRQTSAILDLTENERADAWSELVALAKADNPSVRSTALQALGGSRTPRPEVEEVVCAGLEDPEPVVRSDAAEAVERLGLRRCLPRLIEVLESDEDPTVRADAAEALGSLGAGAEALRTSVQSDEDEAVRAFAASSLGLVSTREVVQGLLETGIQSPWVRFELLLAAYRLGDRAALGEALALLSDRDPMFVERALNALNDLLDRGAFRPTPDGARAIENALRLADESERPDTVIERWRDAAVSE